MEYCFTCGNGENRKYLEVECPECGRKYGTDINLAGKNEKEYNRIVGIAGAVKIPEHYIGNSWDKTYIKSTQYKYAEDQLFDRFLGQLEKIHNLFVAGVIPGKSALIIAPPKFSKVTWAYSCMQACISHNIRVAPLLDTVEVKRLLIKGGENPDYKMFGYLTLENYITTDVVFISVTKSDYKFSASSTIIDILDKRSRKGLPTFIISRYGSHIIARDDVYKEFESILDDCDKTDDLKYPAVITYEI